MQSDCIIKYIHNLFTSLHVTGEICQRKFGRVKAAYRRVSIRNLMQTFMQIQKNFDQFWLRARETGKYQPNMNGFEDWFIRTKVIIVFDSFFRK